MNSWGQLFQPPNIQAGEVHVWLATLDPASTDAYRLSHVLSSDELDRAEGFASPEARRRFVAARGILREVLGACLGVLPSSLIFTHGPHGKPRLAGEGREISFNISHSGEVVLCAVCKGAEVGVDVERVRTDVDHLAVAGRFFSPREVAELRSLADQTRTRAFFSCWTRKEAIIKALGVGLPNMLKDFDVSLAPGVSPEVIATRPDPEEKLQWTLFDLDPGPGYVSALAVRGTGFSVRRWLWDWRRKIR
jgi:4'-phosphopantetheinyl transferase